MIKSALKQTLSRMESTKSRTHTAQTKMYGIKRNSFRFSVFIAVFGDLQKNNQGDFGRYARHMLHIRWKRRLGGSLSTLREICCITGCHDEDFRQLCPTD